MAKQTKKQAVDQRTQQRLAARKEAIQKGVETRRRNREAQKEASAAAQAAEPRQGQQAQAADRQTKRRERDVPSTSLGTGAQRAHDLGPIHGELSRTMATVALRGEQAERFRALAAAQGVSLSSLLVRMMEVFEAQDR